MGEVEEQANRNGIQVIARAAAILRVLKSEQAGMTLGRIAQKVDLPRSTVQRIVYALQDERLIIANPTGGGLRLGPEVSALAEGTRFNIVETCRLFLSELTHATGETADLSVLRGAGMIFLDQVPGTQRLRTVSAVGDVFPLTTTANGQACLSLLPEDRARELIVDEWFRRGIERDLDGYMRDIARIRRHRLAHDLETHTPGIAAIGFAFRDGVGDVHAISVPIPATRFQAVKPQVEQALRKTAEAVDRQLNLGS